MNRIKNPLAIAGIIAGLRVLVAVASAEPGTLPPGQLPTLTAEWWQWALSIPTSVNPQLDDTGQNCMVGQRGSIWFLAGVWLGGTATRACLMPEDATIFFPVTNAINVNSPNVWGQGAENLTVKSMRA